MGVDIDLLKRNMIGLRGKTRDEKIRNYFKDMALAFKEMSRVLKPDKFCVIIVGSNSIQTGGIKHEEEFKTLANEADLELVRDMIKPIKGMKNTPFGEDFMVGAWIGLTQFLYTKKEYREAFKKETGFDIKSVIDARGIDAMIDQSTGYQKEVMTAWADWITLNFWGTE